MKSGFVAVIGRPNAGKSSLINKLVGEKVSIVSPKSQTTRDKICGVLNGEDYQIVFLDTPGIHVAKNKLSNYMLSNVQSATEDTDLVLVVVDGEKGVSPKDLEIIEKYSSYPLFVVFNKIDKVSFERSYPEIERLQGLSGVKEIFPVSARTGKNVELLLEGILPYLKEGERFYPEDEYTDKDMRFIAAETVREKVLLLLDEEIPHGVGVVVTTFEERENGAFICADIVCEKSSHKPVIIGANGSQIKTIGQKAREELERIIGGRVRLELFVKVRENWRDKPANLKDIGYNIKK